MSFLNTCLTRLIHFETNSALHFIRWSFEGVTIKIGSSLHFQDFEVDLYLGQFWQDPRLAFGINRTIILGGMACEKFWLPDTFFVNSIDTRIHRMVFANKKIWINLINGTMMLSAR